MRFSSGIRGAFFAGRATPSTRPRFPAAGALSSRVRDSRAFSSHFLGAERKGRSELNERSLLGRRSSRTSRLSRAGRESRFSRGAWKVRSVRSELKVRSVRTSAPSAFAGLSKRPPPDLRDLKFPSRFPRSLERLRLPGLRSLRDGFSASTSIGIPDGSCAPVISCNFASPGRT